MTGLEVVGLVSGLLAIFSFMTGVTSARDLVRPKSGTDGVATRHTSRANVVFWVSAPVFVVSLAVTLTAGLAGSDSAGAQFLLLVGAATLLLIYGTVAHRALPWAGFMLLSMVMLGMAGLMMGVVSRGEELQGLTTGVLVGAGAGLLALAIRPPQATRAEQAAKPNGGPTGSQHEREVLRAAREHGGELSVIDVALGTALSLDEAQTLLTDLASRRFCQRVTHPSGAVTYRFPDLGRQGGF